MLSSLVMPYANFDDVQAMTSIYKNAQQQDTDLNVIEFIAEQLLSGGLIEDEDEPKLPTKNTTQTPNTIQIQNGALYQHITTAVLQYHCCSTPKLKQPITCTTIPPQEFHKGIFHPPSVV